ncbi:3-oxoacyl-ACP reductase FabG [Sulfurospirillum arcachonense]|uniref:3-oxoacyl-ACP reductase FabG n=1 Tax=Sulfurospirillum arcachonense TaxID=57666 RepID=UPI000469B97B|nr:3-oxoacyl-ACP reductase FabG [Sulfurospirillum arcachonense]
MKRVLVTGATGEIGSAIVRDYAQNGYFVYIHYRGSQEKAQKLLEEIDNGALIQFDVSDKQSIKEALKDLNVDVLVNCAGIIKDKLFFFMEDDDWEDVIKTNLDGYYHVTKQIIVGMIKNKSGSIVNVTSISGLVGNIGQTNYSASKGGIIAFTKALCLEVARYGIRVNAIAPGVIKSQMVEEVDKNIVKMIPAGRLGEPEEVAEVAYFLGDKATYINGEVINISGGMVR